MKPGEEFHWDLGSQHVKVRYLGTSMNAGDGFRLIFAHQSADGSSGSTPSRSFIVFTLRAMFAKWAGLIRTGAVVSDAFPTLRRNRLPTIDGRPGRWSVMGEAGTRFVDTLSDHERQLPMARICHPSIVEAMVRLGGPPTCLDDEPEFDRRVFAEAAKIEKARGGADF